MDQNATTAFLCCNPCPRPSLHQCLKRVKTLRISLRMPDVLRFTSRVQETYERMVADQASITLEEGLDVPFRNLWSDHVWLQTARVRERELTGICR